MRIGPIGSILHQFVVVDRIQMITPMHFCVHEYQKLRFHFWIKCDMELIRMYAAL